MKFNAILKTLGLIALASPLVFAGDCNDIKKYYKDKEVEILSCKENTDGKVIGLQFNEYYESESTENHIDKILSYDTIESLTYVLHASGYEFEDKPEEETENDKSRIIDKLANLKKLKNLEDLSIEYESRVPLGIGHDQHFLGQITENTIKDLTSLKSLQFYGIKLSQKNIEEISNLDNLESLTFDTSSFEKCNNYESLSKLNVKNLKIDSTTHVTTDLVNAIKSVKDLDLYEVEGDIKIDALPNVEKITWDKDDVSSLSKLDNLKELYLKVSPHYGHDLTSLEKLNQIEKFTIVASKIYPGAAGTSCEPLELKFAEDSQLKEINIKIAYPSESSIEEMKKLKNLEKFNAECKTDISSEGKKLLEEANSQFPLKTTPVADDNTTIADDNTTVADDNTTVADDNTTVADDNTTVADDNTTVVDDNTTVADDNTTATDDNTTATDNATATATNVVKRRKCVVRKSN